MADLLNYRKEDSDMNYNINEQKLGFDRRPAMGRTGSGIGKRRRTLFSSGKGTGGRESYIYNE